LKLQKNRLIKKYLFVRRLYVDSIGTGFEYGPTTAGNAAAIHRPSTTIPISANQLQYDAFATNSNKLHLTTGKEKQNIEPNPRNNNSRKSLSF
jgi:hypothetical protein